MIAKLHKKDEKLFSLNKFLPVINNFFAINGRNFCDNFNFGKFGFGDKIFVLIVLIFLQNLLERSNKQINMVHISPPNVF